MLLMTDDEYGESCLMPLSMIAGVAVGGAGGGGRDDDHQIRHRIAPVLRSLPNTSLLINFYLLSNCLFTHLCTSIDGEAKGLALKRFFTAFPVVEFYDWLMSC